MSSQRTNTTTVLIAGIGGASLGIEIAKSLRLATGYRIIGCDISPLAFGHYDGSFDHTVTIALDGYIDNLLEICRNENVKVILPGGEAPTSLVAAASKRFEDQGVIIALNSGDVVARLADKERCFVELERLGFAIPKTVPIGDDGLPHDLPMPCIIKPATGSGGSAFVFFARTLEEAALYAAYLRNNGKRPIAQEYISHDEGEFTVGVLSARNQGILGTLVLKRAFPAKISIAAAGADFLISSGFTQGHIGDYPHVASVATKIARAVGSTGPINVQGRVNREGVFLPFEINPRFSGSTYLRSLAGFNEVDFYLRMLLGKSDAAPLTIEPGWYLRGLKEVAVPDSEARV